MYKPELPDLRRAAERRLQANKGKYPGPDFKGYPGGFRRSIPVPMPRKQDPRNPRNFYWNDEGKFYIKA